MSQIADRADVSIARDYASLIASRHGTPGNQPLGAEAIRRCARSAELLPDLIAFAIRVAEFSDYTHDEVDERKILHELQRDAQALVAKADGRS